MASLLELSHELLHCIFVELQPADLSSLSRTCRDLSSYVKGNWLLHKDVYLRRYDQPAYGEENEPDWEEQLHSITKLERVLESEDRDVKYEHLGFVATLIDNLIETSCKDPEASANIRLLTTLFEKQVNVDTILCSSSLFDRAGKNGHQRAAETRQLRQASAKLHCLYGVPIELIPGRPRYTMGPGYHRSPSICTRLRPHPTHAYARSLVYDLRQYTEGTLWGPFVDDGSQRVDWEKVEAVMIVLGYNLNLFTKRSNGQFPRVWDKPFRGASPNSYLSRPINPAPPSKDEFEQTLALDKQRQSDLDAQDPYGITGTWRRVVCFLDYNDLYSFNFASPIPDGRLREPIENEEGTIELAETLHVTRVEPPGSGDEDEDGGDGLDWSRFTGKRLPVVHFRGTSRSLHASWDPNANSKIRGTVRQTPEGEIRWTTFSIFHGEERWRSEGIQVGGLRSARGVLGNWFDKDYDEHGPAGPTAFWKVTDEMDDGQASSLPLAFF